MNDLCPFFGVKQFRCEVSGKILVGYAFWVGVVDELYQGLTQIFWNIYISIKIYTSILLQQNWKYNISISDLLFPHHKQGESEHPYKKCIVKNE